jgi:RNA polymerase sigma-70 factor, ECF subfamily
MTFDFEKALAAEYPLLRRYARSLMQKLPPQLRTTGNIVWRTDDLMQATCLRALNKRHLYTPKPETDFGAWLRSVMHNLWASNVIKEVRRNKLEAEWTPDIEKEKGTDGNRTVLARLEFLDATRALEALSKKHQQILRLAGEGASDKEMVRTIGAPLGTAKSRLSRARDALERKMSGDVIVDRRRRGAKPSEQRRQAALRAWETRRENASGNHAAPSRPIDGQKASGANVATV